MKTEFLTIFWRDILKFIRIRSMLFTSLVQPAIWLALYGLSMSSNFSLLALGGSPPPGVISVNYLTFMAAGVVSLTILFTCLYSGITLQFDKEFGLMKEIVASPLPRSHILLGLSLSGVVKSLIQATVIFLFGYVLGVRFFEGFSLGSALLSVLGIVLFVVLLALGLLFLSSMIALRLESHEGLQGVITLLSLPLFFASNALYPVNSLPAIVRVASYANPLSHFINGFRYFSLGPDFYAFGMRYTYGSNDVLIALVFLIIFDVVTYLLALWTIKKTKIV